MGELLTTGQVAKELQVHINTVWRYIQKGQLKAFKLGVNSQWRIHREDFDNFLNGKRGGNGKG